MRLYLVLALLVSVVWVGSASAGAPVQAASVPCYVAGNGKTYCIDGPDRLFLNFWQNNGNEQVIGQPISCEGRQLIIDDINTDWYTVQWFERFRLENHVGHPILADVELGRMGFEVLDEAGRADLQNGTVTFPRDPAGQKPGCDFFGAFGQNICTPFQSPWHASGGLSKNGLPLSGYILQESVPNPPGPNVPLDVQWFERVRFEHHPSNPPAFQIQRGLLGNALYYTDGNPKKPPKVSVACTVRFTSQSLTNFRNRGIDPDQLAQEDAALHGQSSVVSSLFIPVRDLPEVPAEQLATQFKQRDLGILNRRPLAALTIAPAGNQQLEPDDYVLTVDANGTVVFAGAKVEQRPVSVYELPTALPRPIAFVTAAQKCVAWLATAICADVSAPQNSDAILEFKKRAIEELGLDGDPDKSPIDFDQAVSLVVGADELNDCANALKGDQVRYDQCAARVLAAPAVEDGAFPAPDDKGGQNIAIGIVEVLSDIREDVFGDPALSQTVNLLPAGIYRVYDVRGDTSINTARGVAVTSIHISGPKGDYYLPGVNAITLRGRRVYGEGPLAGQDAAVSASLFLRDRCFFRAGSCSEQAAR